MNKNDEVKIIMNETVIANRLNVFGNECEECRECRDNFE
jgi:hypothetical protein